MPFIESSGTKLYYEETGSGGPVVFLHEFAADYRTWEAQVRRFSREYRCVTYNARGYPPSGVPETDAADLEDQLRVLDVPVLLAVGDEDDPVIEANIFLKRTLPRAGLWIHPQTGHGLNLEEPSAFNRALAEFFAAVERGTWRRRDPRADPAMSVFLSDKERPADAPR
jgi:pimeloyl-ACP methyl ester carboxylesterase